MQIAKPIKKLKSKNYKLLKHENLIFKFPTKKKKKKLHLHNIFYAIKDGSTRHVDSNQANFLHHQSHWFESGYRLKSYII